ncbi:hypothetical protein [Amycolatopsis thailandensis]|uniref:hypothetical protein n=1 Tax=Amycolatopsis thailandensis TaxID=589330 RepID=UPI001FC9C844|nr:hypothetical protein [Amycolatopsis thailandensis]
MNSSAPRGRRQGTVRHGRVRAPDRRELTAVAASLPRVDALVFTGDIGWNQPEAAEAIASGPGMLGLRGGLSRTRTRDAVISDRNSPVPVLTVQSREELSLAAAAATVL